MCILSRLSLGCISFCVVKSGSVRVREIGSLVSYFGDSLVCVRVFVVLFVIPEREREKERESKDNCSAYSRPSLLVAPAQRLFAYTMI